MTIKCSVIGCSGPTVATGLCRKHYMRKSRHGSVEQTRPNDWGSREKHALYTTWCSIRRYRADVVCREWLADFWAFAHEVKAQPDGKRQQIERLDETALLGPGNWYWRSFKSAPADRAERAAYMREYSQKARDANPDYFKNADLKRTYGITLEWYNTKLAEQNGACAICLQPEKVEIRGKLLMLAVDHDHATGQVRGLLCSNCNRGIGHLDHDMARLQAAIHYLTHHSAEPAGNDFTPPLA
jgi:hypothetical protein